MDLTDLVRTPGPARRPTAEPMDSQALIAQLGGEVASTLSSALERVVALTTTGRIDRQGLRALRDEIDLARRTGIMGQQLVRLSDGRVQLARERLDLTSLLREALRQRGREIEARGIAVRQVIAPAEVMSDPTLAFALLQTVLDWAFEHAVSRVDLKLEVKTWPANAVVGVRFAHRQPDEADTAPAPLAPAEETALNTMSWRLLQQTAAVLGLAVQRKDTPEKSVLTLEFPETLAARMPGVDVVESDGGPSLSHNSQPLAGRHIVVLAARREVRNLVREALRSMGLLIDFVASVEEAQQLCAEGLPHAVVYEASLGGDRLESLRNSMLAEVPGLTFIQIAEQGRSLEMLNEGGRQFTSVGRDAVVESLPVALLFELSHTA